MAPKRVLLAVDSANLYCNACQNGERLDYRALLDYAARLGQVVQAGLYTVRARDGQDRDFLLKAKGLGFGRIVARPARQRPDGKHKSDIDTVIAMDVWQAVLASEVDAVVLASGDSDFVPLVERITERGMPVWIVGPNGSTAWELVVAATQFVDAKDVPGLLAAAPAKGGEAR